MRPDAASSNAIARPSTSGPLPCVQSVSVARQVSPAIRDFPPTLYGKMNTAIQVTSVFVVLLRNAFPGSAMELLADALVRLAAVSTVLSGVHYAVIISKKLSRGL